MDKVVALLGPPQVAQLQGEFPALERIQVEAAWFEIVTEWFEDPSAEQTATDGGYFYTAARRRLKNLVVSEAARRSREERWSQKQPATVAESRVPPDVAIAAAETVVQLGEELAEQVAAFLESKEELVYRLWLEGERRTEVFARELELPEDLSVDEQRKEVKRVKDRTKKKLRRKGHIKELAEPLKDSCADAREKGLRP